MHVTDKEITRMQENLKQLREIAKWSVQDFADMLGVTRQTINNWETNKTPLTKIQYIAIKSCFDEKANDNQTLSDLLEILVYNSEKYKKEEYKEVQKKAKLLSSTAKGGATTIEIGDIWKIILASMPALASAIVGPAVAPVIIKTISTKSTKK